MGSTGVGSNIPALTIGRATYDVKTMGVRSGDQNLSSLNSVTNTLQTNIANLHTNQDNPGEVYISADPSSYYYGDVFYASERNFVNIRGAGRNSTTITSIFSIPAFVLGYKKVQTSKVGNAVQVDAGNFWDLYNSGSPVRTDVSAAGQMWGLRHRSPTVSGSLPTADQYVNFTFPDMSFSYGAGDLYASDASSILTIEFMIIFMSGSSFTTIPLTTPDASYSQNNISMGMADAVVQPSPYQIRFGGSGLGANIQVRFAVANNLDPTTATTFIVTWPFPVPTTPRPHRVTIQLNLNGTTPGTIGQCWIDGVSQGAPTGIPVGPLPYTTFRKNYYTPFRTGWTGFTAKSGGYGTISGMNFDWILAGLKISLGQIYDPNFITSGFPQFINYQGPRGTNPAPVTATASSGGNITAGTYYAVVTYTNLPTPLNTTPTIAQVGGSIRAGSYYVEITYCDPTGALETNSSSSSASLVATSANTALITVPSPSINPNLPNYKVYIRTGTAGSYYLANGATGTPMGTDFNLTSQPPTTGATAPTTFESQPSVVSSPIVITGTSKSITVNSPPATSYPYYNVYISNALTGTYYQASASNLVGTNYVLMTQPPTTGTQAPSMFDVYRYGFDQLTSLAYLGLKDGPSGWTQTGFGATQPNNWGYRFIHIATGYYGLSSLYASSNFVGGGTTINNQLISTSSLASKTCLGFVVSPTSYSGYDYNTTVSISDMRITNSGAAGSAIILGQGHQFRMNNLTINGYAKCISGGLGLSYVSYIHGYQCDAPAPLEANIFANLNYVSIRDFFSLAIGDVAMRFVGCDFEIDGHNFAETQYGDAAIWVHFGGYGGLCRISGLRMDAEILVYYPLITKVAQIVIDGGGGAGSPMVVNIDGYQAGDASMGSCGVLLLPMNYPGDIAYKPTININNWAQSGVGGNVLVQVHDYNWSGTITNVNRQAYVYNEDTFSMIRSLDPSGKTRIKAIRHDLDGPPARGVHTVGGSIFEHYNAANGLPTKTMCTRSGTFNSYPTPVFTGDQIQNLDDPFGTVQSVGAITTPISWASVAYNQI